MAEHSRTLHYQRESQTSGVRLYTTQGDVTSPTVITSGNVVNEGTLSTTAADDITPALRLNDGSTTVYAKLGSTSDSKASSMRVNVNGTTYSVFKETFPAKGKSSYTPAEIKEILNAGKHTEYFNVGDSILPVTLNGTVGIQTFNNETYYATILGFDHNKDLETGGKNSIHFILGKNANGVDIAFCDGEYGTDISTSAFRMNLTNTNADGWSGSYMRNTICSQFKAALPSNLLSVLSSITKYSDNTGSDGDTASYVTATTDDVFLLSEWEVQVARTYANSAEQNKQKQYAYYANGASKVRYKHSDASSAVWWWLRSAHYNGISSFCDVSYSGGADLYSASYSGGFAPCFAIVAD